MDRCGPRARRSRPRVRGLLPGRARHRQGGRAHAVRHAGDRGRARRVGEGRLLRRRSSQRGSRDVTGARRGGGGRPCAHRELVVLRRRPSVRVAGRARGGRGCGGGQGPRPHRRRAPPDARGTQRRARRRPQGGRARGPRIHPHRGRRRSRPRHGGRARSGRRAHLGWWRQRARGGPRDPQRDGQAVAVQRPGAGGDRGRDGSADRGRPDVPGAVRLDDATAPVPRSRMSLPGMRCRRFTQAHHIVWWERGGSTDLDNLVLVCTFHHKLVHEYGWAVERGPHGMVRWIRPDGSRYQAGAGPPRLAISA